MKIINYIKTFKEYKIRAISAEEELSKFKSVAKQNDMLKNEREELKEQIKQKDKLVSKKSNKINELKEEINNLNSSISDYKKLAKQLRGTKGGLTAENNKLKSNISDLTKKLEKSMDEKYLIKKLPPARPRKGQTMRIKSSSKQSNIAKKMFKEINEVSDEDNK